MEAKVIGHIDEIGVPEEQRKKQVKEAREVMMKMTIQQDWETSSKKNKTKVFTGRRCFQKEGGSG